MKNGEVLMLACILMLVLVSAGCTDSVWDRLWGTGNEAENLSPGPAETGGSGPSPSGDDASTPLETEADTNDTGVDLTPTPVVVENEPPAAPANATTARPIPTTYAGYNGDDEAGSFSIRYTPPDGYTAEEGEMLVMVFTIVPEGGFDDEVRVTLDLSVPDPVFGIFPLWSETYDMGIHTPPYPPITQTLALDPDNPPEEYAWVTDVYDTARSAGISEIDVNVHVSAIGGGYTVEERPVYHVRLA